MAINSSEYCLMPDNDVIGEFAKDVEKLGLAERSCGVYRTHVGHFSRWLSRQRKTLSSANGDDVEAYVAEQPDGKLPKGRVSALLRFFEWRRDCYGVHDVKCIEELQRQLQHQPSRALSDVEVGQLRAAFQLRDPVQFRDRAIVELILAAGISRSQLSNLRLNDFDAQRRVLRVGANNGHAREIKLDDETARWVSLFIGGQPTQSASPRADVLNGKRDVGALFPNHHHGKAVSEAAIRRMVRSAGKRAGLATTIIPRSLAKTWRQTAVREAR